MTCLSVQWKSPPADYKIDCNTVHVWRIYFQPTLVPDRKLTEAISAEETEKARRFVRDLDRDRYVFAHALLRLILGAYVGCEPQELVFETNEHGKPFLVSQRRDKGIQFNLSHSGDIALIAVALGTSVGIDVEHIRSIDDAYQIVNSFFSINECQFLNSVHPADFNEAFFACWSSKEAFLKGIGKGLSYPLDKFSVIFADGESESLVRVHDERVAACSWKIVRLSCGRGYSGALAIEGLRSDPKFFQYCWPQPLSNLKSPSLTT